MVKGKRKTRQAGVVRKDTLRSHLPIEANIIFVSFGFQKQCRHSVAKKRQGCKETMDQERKKTKRADPHSLQRKLYQVHRPYDGFLEEPQTGIRERCFNFVRFHLTKPGTFETGFHEVTCGLFKRVSNFWSFSKNAST